MRSRSPNNRNVFSMSLSSKSVRFAPATRVTVGQQSSDESEDENHSESGSELADNAAGGASSGWADAMSRLLNCQVRKGNCILAKAKKDCDVVAPGERRLGTGFEVVKETGEKEVVTDADSIGEKRLRHRKEDVAKRLRQKATDANLTYEGRMNAIATRGVVQLFNAVNQQRIRISKKLEAAGSSETRKDQVLSSVSKRDFLETLKHVSDDREEEIALHPEPESDKKNRKRLKEEKLKFKDVFSDNFMPQDE